MLNNSFILLIIALSFALVYYFSTSKKNEVLLGNMWKMLLIGLGFTSLLEMLNKISAQIDIIIKILKP